MEQCKIFSHQQTSISTSVNHVEKQKWMRLEGILEHANFKSGVRKIVTKHAKMCLWISQFYTYPLKQQWQEMLISKVRGWGCSSVVNFPGTYA